MAIDITCPGCRTRFKVSDKYAGQKGPCPKCKTVIAIPKKGEEVVVHAPEAFGPKTTSGQAVLKPIFRQEAKLSPLAIIGIVAGIVLVLILALMMRSVKSPVVLGLGALGIAFPLVFIGYTFLRDDELEPYRGTSVMIRTAVCSAVYALLWGAYVWVPQYVFSLEHLELFHLAFLIPPLMIAGGATAAGCFDLDFGTGVIHYSFYLIITGGLCFLIGVPLM